MLARDIPLAESGTALRMARAGRAEDEALGRRFAVISSIFRESKSIARMMGKFNLEAEAMAYAYNRIVLE